MKIATKLMAVMLLVSLLPLAICGCAILQELSGLKDDLRSYMSEHLAEHAEHNLEQKSSAMAHAIVTEIKLRRNTVMAVAECPETRNLLIQMQNSGHADTDDVSDHFLDMYNDDPDIDMIRLFYKDGTIVTGTGYGGADVSDYAGERAWFLYAMNPRVTPANSCYISPIQISERTKTPVIRYAVPIDIDGSRLGVFVVNFDPGAVIDPILSPGFEHSGFVMLVDTGYKNTEGTAFPGRTTILGRSDHNGTWYISEDTDAADVIKPSQLSKDAGVLTYNRDGTQHIASYARVDMPDRNWYVVSTIPETEFHESYMEISRAIDHQVSNTKAIISWIGIFAIAIVAIFAIFISGTVATPIRDLADAAEKIGRGNFDIDLEIETDDEFGALSTSFNAMAGQLKDAKVQEGMYQQNLEKQIEERTNKLQESEDYLKELVEKLRISQEELSAPVIQIWDKVLALPLIGLVDEHRINTIMETLLTRITETQSDIVILDVTGVHDIDTYVTNQLLRIVRAAKLLGATCIITGVKPESAQVLVGLGIDMSEMVTRRTLQDGLQYALKIVRGLTRE